MRDLIVLTRPGCMFCKQVQEMLGEAGVAYQVREIAERSEQERLVNKYGAIAFPIILMDDIYIGGFTQVVQLSADGRLGRLLEGSVYDKSPTTTRLRPVPAPTPRGTAPVPRAGTPTGAGEKRPTTGSMLSGFAAFGELMRKPPPPKK